MSSFSPHDAARDRARGPDGNSTRRSITHVRTRDAFTAAFTLEGRGENEEREREREREREGGGGEGEPSPPASALSARFLPGVISTCPSESTHSRTNEPRCLPALRRPMDRRREEGR